MENVSTGETNDWDCQSQFVETNTASLLSFFCCGTALLRFQHVQPFLAQRGFAFICRRARGRAGYKQGREKKEGRSKSKGDGMDWQVFIRSTTV
jgi:hypothetical protein